MTTATVEQMNMTAESLENLDVEELEKRLELSSMSGDWSVEWSITIPF